MLSRKVLVLENDQWITKLLSDLNIGDIIKLQNGDYAPADLIILNTADNQQCSIESYLIDGSPQWQPRTPINFTTNIKENPNFLLHSIRVEHYEEQFAPVSEFNTKYNFFAKLDFNNITYDVNNTNFVEKYSAFYHKGDIICGVIFTESDCISNYSMDPQYKISRFEKEINKLTTWQIYFLVCFALFISIITDLYRSRVSIFSASTRQFILLFVDHFSYYIILLSPLISIQIFTVLDLIIILNSQIIQTQYDRSSIFSIDSLSESTNISSIITSKSMILERKPCLKRIFLNNTIYGTDITAKLLSRNIENDILQNKPLMKDFYDQNLVSNQDNLTFFHHISLCHSASIVGNKNNFNYISRFPDDEQLLKLAANSGYLLVGRTPNESKVLINDKIHTFKTKRIFHSCVRHPRISIIIEDENGNLILLSRGVYKVMLNVVNNIERYAHVYDSFHENGLHVEVCSYKFLTQRELNCFEQKIDSLGEGNSEFEFAFIEALESQSTFISMLGFEDVPRDGCLLFLSRCKKAFNQIIISSQSKGTSLIITEISLGLLEKPIVGTIKGNIPEDVDISISYIMENSNYDVLIITGNSIEHLFNSEYAYQVSEIILKTPNIILQRAGPLQAAKFVEYLQIFTKQHVLAVGHSMYDSSFMKQSNVSVSIPASDLKPCNLVCDMYVNDFDQLADIIFFYMSSLRERIKTMIEQLVIRDCCLCFLLLVFYLFHFDCFTCRNSCEEVYHSGNNILLFPVFVLLTFTNLFTVIPLLLRSIFNHYLQREEIVEKLPNYKEECRSPITWKFFTYIMLLTLCFSIILVYFTHYYFNTCGYQNCPRPIYFFEIIFVLFFGMIFIMLPTIITWNIPSVLIGIMNIIGFISICFLASSNNPYSYYFGGCQSLFSDRMSFWFISSCSLIIFAIQFFRIKIYNNRTSRHKESFFAHDNHELL